MIPRIAVLCDSPDEHWPSMDTVGLMLVEQLRLIGGVKVERVAPPIRALFPHANANRLWLRFADYPRWLARNRSRFDLFHIVDHSYAQLVHSLPPGRTVVTCHDIDTFRSVLEPERDPRGFVFRAMTRRILTGLQRAAHVVCDSGATMAALEHHQVLPPSRMSVVPLGAHPSCSPDPNPPADAEAARLLGPAGAIDLLHVGSTIPRKRIDILLRIVSELRRTGFPVRLVRAGGPLTPAQRALAQDLMLEPFLIELPFLERDVLSAVYRGASLVLQPSDAEGFGLPVAEAMACGTPVIASDLGVLREIGGGAAVYCQPGNIPDWVAAIGEMLYVKDASPQEWKRRKLACLGQAAGFSWNNYAANMLEVYNKNLIVQKSNYNKTPSSEC